MQPYGTYQIEIYPIDAIHPTEEHGSDHVENLIREIEITGVWTHPLLVDAHMGALMDGHHRFQAAQDLGLAAVPVIRMSYDDPAVSLRSWRPDETFTPQMIWDICASKTLLPMKSTRHIVTAQLPFSRVPLDWLRTREHIGQTVPPAAPHPSRSQILSEDYHAFGARMGLRTVSAARLDVETDHTIVPHPHLRRTLKSDPAMAALLSAAPCRIALGQQKDAPFRLKTHDLLVLPPSLLANPGAVSVAARWGIEASFALQLGQRRLTSRRLTALLRFGATLITKLGYAERALILSDLPPEVGAELIGSDLSTPSAGLLTWMRRRLDASDGAAPASDPVGSEALPLESLVEQVLVSNGDSRLVVDPRTGRNKYGTTARPRPEAVHFSSSTASSISDYGFLFCDVLRRDLLNHILDAGNDVHDSHAALSDAIIGELIDIASADPASVDGAIAPSGTDTEVLAVLLARAADPEAKLVNILISPEETGRGVKLAGAGLWFDELSATGAPIRKGAPIWPGASIDVVDIAIRNPDGTHRDLAELDAAFLAAGKSALESGARVLAHVLIGSKTGLSGPSNAAVDRLVAMAPDKVDVVVDACQMRVEFSALGECLARGWMVQVSGSKSLTGPPFSGALLFPSHLRRRADASRALLHPGVGYPEDWSAAWYAKLGRSPQAPAFGAGFRWLPALLEAKLLRRIPEALSTHVLERFRSEVTERLVDSASFRVLPRMSDGNADTLDGHFARHSIISFEVLTRRWDGSAAPLDEPECRKLFELLNQDARGLMPGASPAISSLLSQEFHIGQPVKLGEGANSRAVLRLVIGMRFFNIVGHAGPGAIAAALESEISDLLRAVDKLEILAENWWSFADGRF